MENCKGVEAVNMAANEQHTGESRQLVVFSIADEIYGVDIHQVKEIIRVPDITRVPRTPEFVEGVVNLRGSVIPVLDLRKRFGFDSGEANSDQRIVVMEMGNQIVGMIVDSVSEVLQVDVEDVEAPSPYVVSVDSQYIAGIVKLEERLIILLDADRVLSSEEREAVAQLAAEEE